MSSFLYVLGRWTVKARILVLVLWLVGLAVLWAGGLSLYKGLDNTVTIPGTESGNALERLYATFPEVSGSPAQIIVVGPEDADITFGPVKDSINKALEQFYDVEGVEIVTPIDDPLMPAKISENGNAALITVQVVAETNVVGTETKESLKDVCETLNLSVPQGYTAKLGGTLFSQEFPTISIVEVLGVVGALIVLFITLGTLIGSGMPIVVALAGVGVSMALVFIGTSFSTINATTPLLGVMLGLAVGIDYALFIISRHRDNLKTGMPVTESIARSLATAGSAVTFTGVTTVIAILGLAVPGIPFLAVMGVVGAGGVALAALSACTLLPAILSFVGLRILTKKEQKVLESHRSEMFEGKNVVNGERTIKPNRFFNMWIKGVTANPLVTIVVVIVTLTALAVPALNLRVALPDAGILPQTNEARVTYDLIDDYFGEGYNGPLIVTAPILTSTDPLGLVDSLKKEIATVPGVAEIAMATPNATADTAIIQVIPQHGGRSNETAQLVRDLRGMRNYFETEYGVDIAVTGSTAVGVDVSAKLMDALLPFAIMVVGLSFILLTMVFRSVAIPTLTVIGYLFSVASAYGVVALVFERGFLAGPLGVAALGPVINFMPLVTMAILFGLSMDYMVFLVSRMLEDYALTSKAKQSIYTGFMASAKVVTAAAIIMVSVFVAFVPQGDMNLKPIALGLAVGVAIDAFVVRMCLVPAAMTLLGEKAWWIPKFLDQIIPHFDIEGAGVLRERSLKDWPGTPTTVAVADLVLQEGTASQVKIDFLLPRGQNLVVRGTDRNQLVELIETLGGRCKNNSGTVKVLDLLLPQRGPTVRSRVACLQPSTNTEMRQYLKQAIQEKAKMLVIYVGPKVDDFETLRDASKNVPIVVASTEEIGLPHDSWNTFELDCGFEPFGTERGQSSVTDRSDKRKRVTSITEGVNL